MGVSVPQRLDFTVWYRCVLWDGGSSARRGLAPGSPATPEAVPARSQQIASRAQARAADSWHRTLGHDTHVGCTCCTGSLTALLTPQ